MFELIKKNAIRKIDKSKKRFFSIVIITLLGTGIFVGLKSTSSNMMETLDTYLDRTNTYDIKIISSLGLTEKDIKTLNNLESINMVTGAYFKDVVADLGSKKAVIQLNSINKNINNIELIEGKMPEQKDEILVEPALLKRNEGIKIGDYIQVNDESLEISKFKIVGTAKSPLYIGPETYSGSRGLTTVGNGYVNYYSYVLEETIKTEYYPVVYLTVKGAQNKVTSFNEYEETIKNAIAEIETIKDENQKIRYNDIFNSVNDKINSKIAEGEKELDEYKNLLDDADEKLQKGNNELKSSKRLLQKHTKEIEEAQKTIDETATILEGKKVELQNYKAQLDEANALISEKNAELDNANNMLGKTKAELDNAKSELEKVKAMLDENKVLLQGKKGELDLARTNLDNGKEELNNLLKPYKLSYEKVKNIKDYIDISSERKEKIISYIPKKIKHYDRIVEFINKIYDTTSDDIFNYVHKYSDIIGSLIEGIPTQWKAHDIIVSFLSAVQGRIDEFCSINTAVNAITVGESEYKKYSEQFNEAEKLYNSKLEEYNKQKALYEEALRKYNEAYNAYLLGKKELDNKKEEYGKAYTIYEQGVEELEKSIKQYESGYAQLLASKKKIENGKIKWNESNKLYQAKLEEYNENLEKYNSLKEQFESEVQQARAEIDKIPESIWYIYGRKDDSNYGSFLDAYNSIINLSKIFPVLFYALAVFVCMINISRMVDEDRKEIGIFKALGTEKTFIKANYIFYSLIATIIGGFIGAILGFYLLPFFIWNAYSIAFDIPNYEIAYNLLYIISGIVISVVLIEITTNLSIRKVLNESIVSLNRPKLPKNGKKALLEKIPFIGKRLPFKSRLIIRNIFLYKKKILMTILSTVGGILLLLIGFSIKYSITAIVDLQYGRLNTSDLIVNINSNTSNDKIAEILNDARIKNYQKMNISSVTTNEFYEVYLQAVDEPYSNEVNFYDVNTGERLELVDNEVIISSKLAILLNKNISDTIEIVLQDNSKKSLKISGISESYWEHTISMNKNTFEKEFSEYKTNLIYITLKDKQEEENVITSLINQEEIQNVVSIKDVKQQINNTLRPLDKIVMLLIALSALLTIVVLYNLAIINISERKKEISTLKVLGFKKRELDYYIISETIILAIIGIIIGLLIGRSISMFIVKGLEIEKARYVYEMMPQTYLYSTLLMILFIVITSVLTHFGLKKIKLNEK